MSLPAASTPSPRPWVQRSRIAALFAGLTVIMTWPHAMVLGTRTVDSFDIYFNLWRLRWIHHALSSSARDLFNGNQFSPEPGVLAYSDAILVQGLIASPLLAAGLRPMLVHNLLLLGGMAGSGVAMFVLARHLSKHDGAAILAGVVFAFAPYRFGHIMHLEMQWGMWIPLAFWALHRAVESGALKFGMLTGLFLALQFLSCVYYGIFLGALLPIAGVLQLWLGPGGRRPAANRGLAAGAVLAAVAAWIYSAPYRTAAAMVGVRSIAEVREWSGSLTSYLAVSDSNVFYSWLFNGGDEHCLFPGLVTVIFAAVAVAATRPRRALLPYLVGLALAFDLSLGFNGLLYPHLYEHLAVVRGLRAPARVSIFVLFFLGAIGAVGGAAALRAVAPRLQGIAVAVVIAAALLEYWVAPLRLVAYPNEAPPLYAFLARLPAGIVGHFPIAHRYRLPGFEPRYLYGSTFHWKPIINGYSGYYPPSYLNRLIALDGFPGAGALGQLGADRVRYLVVHEAHYRTRAELEAVIVALQRAGAAPLARLHDGVAAATVFELRQ